MPQSTNILRTLLLLAASCGIACAAGPDDPDSYQDDLASTHSTDDHNVIQSAVTCDPRRPRTCGMVRLPDEPPGSGAIRARLQSLHPDIRSEYFERAVDTSPLVTADGRGAYQFFEGTSGTGAIYSNPEGLVWNAETESWVTGRVTEPIYGAFLGYWLDHGYELALGYPSSPEYAESDDPSSVREQRFGEVLVHTSPNGSVGETTTLRWAGWYGVWGKGHLGIALDGYTPDYTFELVSRNEPAWSAPCTVYGAPYAWSNGDPSCAM